VSTLERILDHVADIYVSLKAIGAELDGWNAQVRGGRITLGGVSQMTIPEGPTPIPADDVPALVQWFDRLGTELQHSATDTTWSAEDASGAASQAVTVQPDLDADSTDETATVVFSASSGQFKVVATTPGEGGATVRAESTLYDIQPGAAAVGQITLNPV
jgi:hypothetical protein